MATYIGSQGITKYYMGSNALHKLYKGSTLIWQESIVTSDTIYYTSSDGNIVTPYATGESVFGANIVSNTYSGGQGVITFDGPVTSIGSYAFHSCGTLESINIPVGVTSIGPSAFENCGALSNVTIPEGVTTISSNAFKNVPITGITLPNTIATIGYHAFYGCRLRTINISSAVTRLDEASLSFCTYLSSITGTHSGITSDNRCIGVDGKLIGFAPSGLTSYSIPSTFTSIGMGAFETCSSLTSITIPNTITSIGMSAFKYCTSLRSISIPDSVTSIDDEAVFGCNSLQTVSIGSGVTSIGYAAFASSMGVTSITITVTTPPTLQNAVFDLTNNCPIYVPAASVDTYKAATNWRGYADRIQPIP